MSEPKIVSPLLDGFAMGNAISEHSGIRSCPAIKENTDKKYIVKIISIPASQIQMDALLLAGAYKDPSEAMEYFKEQSEGVIKEAELLKNLSKLEGFLSYEGWQMEPITRYRLGYEIYLLGSYKRALDKYIRNHAITHLEAIHLGLDMCTALSVARQAGALYVDLKPSNIFISDKMEYRIGDLGFLKLDELSYTALPEKYQSSYTPPELYDPMSTVNLTADTYALGMILYQLYNDGALPFKGKAPDEELPTPVQADYELAEIIMKAIHPDPELRWTDPKEMGKALASYMERNSISDVAITPLRIKTPCKKATEASFSSSEGILSDSFEAESLKETEDITTISESLSEEIGESRADNSVENFSEDISESVNEAPEEDDAPLEETEEAIGLENNKIISPQEDVITLTGDMARIMEKAEDLIAHEIPEEMLVPEEADVEDPFAFASQEEELNDSEIPYDPLMDDVEDKEAKKTRKKENKFIDPKYQHKKKRIRSLLTSLLILLAMTAAGYWYYQNLFLQTVHSIIIDGDQTQITVTIDSDIPDDKLSLLCTSNLGTSETASLVNGTATFSGLQSNTMYTVQLQIHGLHRLVGQTTQVFTTEATTNIVSFTSVAGAEDGSVMLNFTVDGDEPPFWTLHYQAEGEESREETFSGHTIDVSDLTLGKVYTFTLDAGEHLTLSGETTLEVMASRLILAENLVVVSGNGSDITVHWNAPGDVVIDSWNVRCYNVAGYEEQFTVTKPEVTFTGIDPSFEYTIEVVASGMTQPARTGITANPINITSVNTDMDSPKQLKLNWDFSDDAPESGWLLMYSVDGDEPNVLKCDRPIASISPKIPGAKYSFTIQAADGTSVFNNTHFFSVPAAEAFTDNAIQPDKLSIDLVRTPDEKNWHFESIGSNAISTQFSVGDPISIVLRSSESFYLPGDETQILYVIRDSYGNVLAEHVTEEKIIWKSIWAGGDVKNGELDIPSVPSTPGKYQLDLYFDGKSVAQLPFTLF